MLAVAGALAHMLLGYSWKGTSGHAYGSDDAFITFRYAQNLWQGNGLVFNAGERVEGYSNFLYALLVTPSFGFGTSVVYPFSLVLNTSFYLASICLFWVYASQKLDQSLALLGCALLAINPFVWANVATGLETPLILLITTSLWGAVMKYVDGPRRAALWGIGALCIISILARVDGFILPVATAIFLAIRGRSRAALIVFLLTVGVMAIYTGLRLVYYGDVISNTYYAKVSGPLSIRIPNGIEFMWTNALHTGLIVGGIAAIIRLVGVFSRGLQTLDFTTWVLGVWTVYLVYIGGDIYYERFLIALLPLGLFSALSFAQPHLQKSGFKVALFAILAVLPFGFALQDGRFAYRDANTFPKYDFWVETGEFLGKTYPDAVLAIDAAGKVPFFSGLQTIDMLGLNDRQIGKMPVADEQHLQGHMKFDPDYVLGRSPDLIAAWLKKDLDLAWGLQRSIYSEAYEIGYLVNPSRQSLWDRNIIDVSEMAPEQVEELFKSGYLYAILVRR